MRSSKTIQKWREGKPVLATTLHFTDPAVYELTSLMGFDLIWMDLEHHAVSLETAGSLMRAARVGGADILARPAKGEFSRMARLLEAGAQGIIYPRCNSAEEAKEVVSNAKFYPLGMRGVDGAGPDAPYGSLGLKEYTEAANQETFILLQIEDSLGLQNAESIANVEGVDMLFFGPGDYSVQAGFAGNYEDPRYWQALKEVARSAEDAGKMWGTPSFSVDHAKKLLDAGAMLITRTSDLTLLRSSLQHMQQEFQSLDFRFDNRISPFS